MAKKQTETTVAPTTAVTTIPAQTSKPASKMKIKLSLQQAKNLLVSELPKINDPEKVAALWSLIVGGEATFKKETYTRGHEEYEKQREQWSRMPTEIMHSYIEVEFDSSWDLIRRLIPGDEGYEAGGRY